MRADNAGRKASPYGVSREQGCGARWWRLARAVASDRRPKFLLRIPTLPMEGTTDASERGKFEGNVKERENER